ncbi:thiolase family protein [Litoreibacter sp.]|nr:thiolase family protein [Litoreibacter sp.]
MPDVVITGSARTPMGAFLGELKTQTASELGGAAIRAAVEQTTLDPSEMSEVLMGCVLPAGQGQAPARQAGFHAGLGQDVPATTLNKMCGSGMKAAMLGVSQIASGQADHVVAGGMESMSNAPYLLPKMRDGARLGHARATDHMFLDGLEDAYERGTLMGAIADDFAQSRQISREEQDEFALSSLTRATEASEGGIFSTEISQLEITTRSGSTIIQNDETPFKARPAKIPTLKPAFRPDGTVTAANASSISDGAAALVLSNQDIAKAKGLPIRARIIGAANKAIAPRDFPFAPVPAAQMLLERIGWDAASVDLWEVNEAFAVVPMAFMREFDIPHDRINIHGGACALGHPIGASGARIIVTLLNALELRGLRRGVAAICIGGGEGTAIAIERDA